MRNADFLLPNAKPKELSVNYLTEQKPLWVLAFLSFFRITTSNRTNAYLQTKRNHTYKNTLS